MRKIRIACLAVGLSVVGLSVSGHALAQSSTSTLTPTATPTKNQMDHLDSLMDARQSTPFLDNAMHEARPLVERAITTSACATSAASFNDLNDVLVRPRKWGTLIDSEGYVGEFFHHRAPSDCLDVLWIKPRRISSNEFAVNARYAAGEDKRYVHQSFYFRKVQDGAWRISIIDAAFEHGL